MFISQAVALRTTELLKEKRMTKYALQKKMGLSKDTLKNIYRNKTQGVNLKTVCIIAEGLGVTLSRFFDSELFLYTNLTID